MAGKQRYKAQEVADALVEAKGIKSLAAELLGCDWKTVDNYCKRYRVCQEACEVAREELVDLAESKLWVAVNAGQWPQVKYTLSTLGRKRGYGEVGDEDRPVVVRILKPGQLDRI